MKSRPWPLVLLAAFQILTPAGTILFNAWALGIQPTDLLQWILQRPPLEIFETLLLMPIAGFAIYQMKTWSYIVFFAAMFWSAGENIHHWGYASHSFPLWMMSLLYALQVGLAIYFIIPSVRRTYFDPRVRWWEAKRRFILRIPVQIHLGEGSHTHDFDGQMENISEGGVLVHTRHELDKTQATRISFSALGMNFEAPAEIVYASQKAKGDRAYGIQFLHTHQGHKRFRKFVKGLELMGLEDRDHETRKPWYVGIGEWLVQVLRTGKGLLPEVGGERGRSAKKLPGED